ncbi:MAG: hypothetical protein KG003_08235 [Bacteroidetes bacterium]|nr:hypothetical protein [Bacteroidota bacterium]
MKNIILGLLLLISGRLSAQHFGPIANGYYSGIHAAKINPALTAYTPYKWHLNLVGIWANVNNNYLSLHLPYSAYKYINNGMAPQYKDENGNPKFDTSWLHEHINNRNKHAAAGAMLYGPSFTIKIKRWHLGLVTDATGLARISGLSENLAHAFYKELDSARGAFQYFYWDKNNNVQIHKTTLSTNAWISAGANVSYSLPMAWKKELMFGATIKKVWGMGGNYLQYDNMTLHQVGPDSITLSGTNVRYSEYYNNGKGMGLDFGIAYVYHKPEYRQQGGYSDKHTRYLWKLGLSVLDIGKIRYKDAYYTTIVNNNTIGWNIRNDQNKFQNQGNGVGVADNVLNELPNMKHVNRKEIIGLPTRIAFTADYQIMPDLYLNTTWVQSLRSRYSVHARHQSYVMLAPRYEREFFEFSLPVFLEYDYRSLRAGASLRMGWFYIGSNSVVSMLYTRALRDADVYMGITISDLPGKWRDRKIKEMEKKKSDNKAHDCEKM